MDGVERIIGLFKAHGNNTYFGESVTITEHMIQCAMAATHANECKTVVLACLLHDIGHFLAADDMAGLGVKDHALLAHDYLKTLGMDSTVCHLIKHHVNAKRYMVKKDPQYSLRLSEASTKTLHYQGSEMTDEEMVALEKDPLFEEILRVRFYDDLGKASDVKNIDDIDSFKMLIKSALK